MNLADLIKKYGNRGLKMDGWFTLKDPSLDDVRRAAAIGRLEDAGFRIPVELKNYFAITTDGDLIVKNEIPDKLKGLAEETRAAYLRAVKCLE